jgi:hypothetical protein
MRLQIVAVLGALTCALRSDATVYPHHVDVDSGPYMEFASDWMSSFLSLRVRNNDKRYDDVIKELMKVQCEGERFEDPLHRREVIDRTPVDALLPLDAWDDSLDVRCGCFEDPRNRRDARVCGTVWNNYKGLRR